MGPRVRGDDNSDGLGGTRKPKIHPRRMPPSPLKSMRALTAAESLTFGFGAVWSRNLWEAWLAYA